MNKVSAWSQGITLLLFTVQGICVYLVWGRCVAHVLPRRHALGCLLLSSFFFSVSLSFRDIDDDFISNLSLNNSEYIFYFSSWLSTMTQFVIVFGCFLGLPMDAFTSRTNLHSIYRSIQRSWMAYQERRDRDSLSMEELEDAEQSEYLLLDRDIPSRSSIEIDTEEASLCARCVEAAALIISAAVVAILCTDLNLIITLCGATYACFIRHVSCWKCFLLCVTSFKFFFGFLT